MEGIDGTNRGHRRTAQLLVKVTETSVLGVSCELYYLGAAGMSSAKHCQTGVQRVSGVMVSLSLSLSLSLMSL